MHRECVAFEPDGARRSADAKAQVAWGQDARPYAAVACPTPEEHLMSVATLEIQELKPGFGAEIFGVDLHQAAAADRAAAVDVFQRHGAILLRDQKLTPEDLETLVASFG